MKTSTFFLNLFVLFMIGTLVACTSTKSLDALPDTAFGKTWTLVKMGAGPEVEQAIEANPPTLNFDKSEKRISGSAACNNYFATIAVEQNDYRFHQMGSTRKMCTPDVMNVEKAYLNALQFVTGWKMEGDRLVLITQDEKELVFQ